MTRKINAEQLIAKMKARVERLGSQSKLAGELTISPGYLNDIFTGRKSISDEVADGMGYTRIIMFEEQSK